MADVKEIVRQISMLAEELGREVDSALAASGAEAQARLDAVSLELEQARGEKDEALAARQEAERELDVAEKRVESLVQKLKEARQAAVEAGEEAQRTLRRQLEALQSECDDARAELDQERSVRKRLEKGAAADEKRLSDLEKALAAGKVTTGSVVEPAEFATLQAELAAARETAAKERCSREGLEGELAEAVKKRTALELALKQAENAGPASAGEDAAIGAQVEELTAKVKSLEADLAAEQQVCRRYARECAEAQRRIVELEGAVGTASQTPVTERPVVAKASADKPLPHELRPAPKPGALFQPNWDLDSLPCNSAEQILQAWASVSNVQLSLEGYPSQYCSAHLVVIKQGKQKQLYMLFNLKGIKHVLVCVPATPPKDESSLGRLVEEGQKYLLMSGFDLEKLSAEDVPKRLGHYLQI